MQITEPQKNFFLKLKTKQKKIIMTCTFQSTHLIR